MSNDILIWGAGAIGGTVGAWLAPGEISYSNRGAAVIGEPDGQLGVILSHAAALGITCPTVAALLRQIQQIEAGERPLSDHNLNELLL